MNVGLIILVIKIGLTLILSLAFAFILNRFLTRRRRENDIKQGIKYITENKYLVDGKSYDLQAEMKKQNPKTLPYLLHDQPKEKHNEIKQQKSNKANDRKPGAKPNPKRGTSVVRSKRK